MANKNDNLIPQAHVLTVEEQSRGGKASVKARKERKTLKEELIMLLEKNNSQERISLALLQRALDGDTKAFEVIRDTVGEKPTNKVEADVNANVEINIELTDADE